MYSRGVYNEIAVREVRFAWRALEEMFEAGPGSGGRALRRGLKAGVELGVAWLHVDAGVSSDFFAAFLGEGWKKAWMMLVGDVCVRRRPRDGLREVPVSEAKRGPHKRSRG